jgi:hypothetical protein
MGNGLPKYCILLLHKAGPTTSDPYKIKEELNIYTSYWEDFVWKMGVSYKQVSNFSFKKHQKYTAYDPFSLSVTSVSIYNHTVSTNKAAKIEGMNVNILMTTWRN